MATVYKVSGEACSAFTNYPPEEIEKEIKKFLKEKILMESIEIKVIRKS